MCQLILENQVNSNVTYLTQKICFFKKWLGLQRHIITSLQASWDNYFSNKLDKARSHGLVFKVEDL